MASQFEVIAAVTKETKASKVGIRLKTEPDDEYPLVTKLSDVSPFHETGLKIGMKVLSINSVDLKGKSPEECAGIIKDAVGEVAILATFEDFVNIAKKGLIVKKDYRDVNLPRWYIPDNLVTAGVTEEDWGKIYDMVHDKFLPSLSETEELVDKVRDGFDGYVKGQMIGGVVGFGSESRKELQALKMLKDAADANDNLQYVAMNLLIVATAILNRRGVAVELALRKSVPQKCFTKARPIGLKFIVI